MEKLSRIREKIDKGGIDKRIREIYVDEGRVLYNRNRYVKSIDRFKELFAKEDDIELYSAPGRSEVCGNHTDHQNGMVLATSINLDAIAVAAKTDDNVIRIISDNLPMECIELSDISLREAEKGTTAALIRGVAAGLKERGYKLGGFNAYITSDVLMGAGMSSSAAFESLIGSVLSGLYNNMEVSSIELAMIGQYAEKVYFGKPCGLMDQMACSVGGMVFIDFADKESPVVEKVESNFEKAGISLCIVDTKGSHADLTSDYAEVTREMTSVANLLGKEYLREVDEDEFYRQLPMLCSKASGRAVLRSIHFFEEEKRVKEAVSALKESDYEGFLDVIKESGASSAKYLQNIYSPSDIYRQNVTVALGVTESIIGDKGVCRVHGGGFAGTIQVFIKDEAVSDYKSRIEKVFGEDSCHVLKVRKYGGIRVL